MTVPRYDILLVEDNLDIAEFEMRVLSRLEVNVRHATTVRGAIALYNQHKPNLIILDVNLPDLGGWQLLEYAAQKGRMPAVIVASASDDMLNRLNSKLHNVDHYLLKPVNKQQLLDVVGEVMQNQQAAR